VLPVTLTAQYNEHIIKAAYVERITRFIDWPSQVAPKDSTLFTIGIYGDNDFFSVLKTSLLNKTIKGKAVEIIKLVKPLKVELCDICYISGINEEDIDFLVAEANKYGVLLMTEKKGLGEKGVHFNFYLEDNKLKFEINRNSIDSGKFKVSSLLMKSSKVL
jgi:hypothetical protein